LEPTAPTDAIADVTGPDAGSTSSASRNAEADADVHHRRTERKQFTDDKNGNRATNVATD